MRSLKKFALSGLSAVALGASLGAMAAETPKTVTQGELKVGMEVSYPPFEYYEDEKVVGFDPEVSAELAKRMGLTASFNDTRFPNLILGLNSNRFDTIISGMYILPERLEQADAIPYAKTGAAIMVRADAAHKPESEHDLCGLTVGLQQGTSWVKKLNDLSAGYCKEEGKGGITVNEYPTNSEASQAMLSGHVQAHVEIDGASQMIVDKSRGRIVISSTESIYPEILGIYVKKGNDQLLDSLKAALEDFKQSGDYSLLIQKYGLEEA